MELFVMSSKIRAHGMGVASLGSSRMIVGGVVSIGSGLGIDHRVGSSGNASLASETPSPSVSVKVGFPL